MPSKDTYHQENPATNREIESSVPERPKETSSPEPGRPASRIAPSAAVVRLARRLRVSPEELAAKIPPDTLRRTRYPVLEQVDEDGKRSYKHDPQIADAPRSTLG